MAQQIITFHTIESKLKEWLHLSDLSPLKVILATVLINHYPADPLWTFIVGPSSGLKTEMIRAHGKTSKVYSLSSLTPQTFVSGFKAKQDVSLLPKINGHILMLKDFTTVLTMHREKRAEILSQLREIYDGEYKKSFGTGKTVDWKGKIGLVAGVTPIIDSHYAIYQNLGERFIQYRMAPEDPISAAKKAMANTGNEAKMRGEISILIANFAQQVINSNLSLNANIITSDMEEKIAHLAAFCVRARSGVVRDGRSRELLYTPEPEAPPRFAKQLQLLGNGLTKIHGSDTIAAEEYDLIYRVGMDSLPKIKAQVIQLLLKSKDYVKTEEVAQKARYPLNTIRRLMADFDSLKLVTKQASPERWVLSDLSQQYLSVAVPEKSEG